MKKDYKDNYDETSYEDFSYLDEDINEDDDEVVEFDNYNNTDYDYDYEDDEETEDDLDQYEEKNKFPNMKKFVIIIILLIILFLIIWLTPLIMHRNKGTNSKINTDDIKTIVSDKAINNNISKVKYAALTYFNKENIPTLENDIKKVTVEDLILKGNLKTFDKNNYDLKNSYATLQKAADKFILKVKLIANKDKYLEKEYKVSNNSNCISTYLCEDNDINDDIAKDDDENNYSYEYSKTSTSISEWSNWSNKEQVDCGTSDIICDDNDSNCLEEVEITSEQEQATITKNYKGNRNVFKTVKIEKINTCANKQYLVINNKIYKTPGNFLAISKLTKNLQANYGNWIYNGRKSYKMPPNDTIKLRYIYIGVDTNCNNCQENPNYIYDKYSYNSNLKEVKSFTNCNKIENKFVPTYSITNQVVSINENITTPTNVCYKTTRTRKLVENIEDTKWSTYNDTDLLEEGYKYTGNKKEKGE